jgi:hypothetical protein
MESESNAKYRREKMKKAFLAGVAAMFLATGTAHADGFPSNA